jgi:DNA-binding transcriptional LysR family regulator
MVAEEGSLSAAARKLGASQPTLGRQIKALEHQPGASLFTRQARGLELTQTGAALVAPARAMRWDR